MLKIKRQTLAAIAEAAKNTYPNEFIALLGCKRKGSKVVDEFVVLPSTYGKTFSSIRLDLLPYTAGTKGSVHSHPGPYNTPSRADMQAFARFGGINLIIAYPFSLESAKAFDANGKEIGVEIVE